MFRITRKILALKVCFRIGVICLSSQSLAAEFFEPPPLRIVWEREKGFKESESNRKRSENLWVKACGNLAKGLLIGKGPWAMGIFKSVSCYVGDQLVAGRNVPDYWTLTYLENDKETTLTVRQPGSSKLDAAKISFRSSNYAMQFFLDQGFVDLVALRILNELPVMGWVPKGVLASELTRKSRSIYVPPSGSRLYKMAQPPENLILYAAELRNSFLMPEIRGQAVRIAMVEPEPISTAEQVKNAQKKKVTKEYSLTWKFDAPSRVVNSKQGAWVHDARGAGSLITELDEAIKDAADQLNTAIDEGLLSRLLKGLKASAASGYVGIRYGSQVLSGDPLIKETAFFGLVAEVRGGPIEGFRYYWDKVPARKQVVDGLDTNIEWSRQIIGKSFGLSLSRFVDRIDITPKIGVWSFNAKLVDSYNDDGTAATVGHFKIANGMSFSLEAGAEWLSNWYTIRPWYSYDYANAINSVTNKKVTSSRIGFDTYWTAGPVFKVFGMPLKTALMGFFIYESISLSSSNGNPTLSEGEREIVEVTFSGAYAGAGLAISW
jgi:hypothetical protein